MQGCGVDIYNLCNTGETAVSVTTYTGHSTGTGPKVVSRKGRISGDGGVCGTLCALMYRKNCNQDNLFYVINQKESEEMEKIEMEATPTPMEYLKKVLGEGKDVLSVVALAENLLSIVASGTMTVAQAIEAMQQIKASLKGSNDTTPNIADDENGKPDEEVCIVRRLTPTETARLQGFPDDYTKIDGPETSDAPQFKSHGNSWATPCANFVSTRIEMELRRLGHEGTIRYATCCSGIEAHSVAVRNLDWKALFFSEIEPFPCRVLAKHYPTVPNLGDMTQIRYDADKGMIVNKPEENYSLPKKFVMAKEQFIPYKIGDMQVFSGGTPCQSVSVAGKREGMAENSGTRSSLAFHFQRIIDECKPTFTIWENVPGALSSNGGMDFIWFVNKCAESGYAMAWRVLDAQYTMTEEFTRAVPQRRRRIWLVGYRGNDWRIPARIVFEKNRDLTDNPPDRIPGLGFKTLNAEADIESIRKEHEEGQKKQNSDDVFDLFSSMEDTSPKAKKVSQMIPLEEFPDNPDFSKVRMVEIFEFAKKIGETGYLGDVFRKDKKTAVQMLTAEELAKLEEDDAEVVSKYEKFKEMEKNGELQWEGAEKISPDILENIGNAGILANGRILTMDCHEWTAGIQLSPSTYNAWEQIVKHQDWLKANALLPEAYDETVCGLSDVLQEDPDEKYNLSWRACFGILRRAETRGKELPEALEIALISNIRENAGIVKWVALYGCDTKKKPTDMTEREIAQTCFDKYIASVIKFEDVVAEQPSRKSGEIGDPDFDDEEEEQEFLDDEANEKYDNGDEEAAYWERSKAAKDFHDKRAAMPDLPNGCINESGGETAPTIVASQYKGPGNTQDATIVATKKEGRFPKEENA